MGLDGIRGHAALRRLLARAVARDTLPPSLLLTGPEGVGKRRTALALAELLNCESEETGETRDACGRCRACRRIARGLHGDVIVVEPEESGAIKVETIRGVVERSGYRPFEGRRRVVVVDDADRMVDAAQNVLLKILEEPPPASVFFLVTARPHMLLPTVRSRCPALRFGRLGTEELADLLVADHGFAPPTALAAAAAADGSVGRAIETGSDEQVRARAHAAEALRALAGARSPKQRLETARALGAARGGTRSGPAADRETLGRRLRALGSLLRDLQLVAARGEPAWLANADLATDLTALARAFDGGRARRGFASVDRAMDALSRNASPKVVVDWLALQL